MVSSAGDTMVCSSAEMNMASMMPDMIATIVPWSSGAAAGAAAPLSGGFGAVMAGHHADPARKFNCGNGRAGLSARSFRGASASERARNPDEQALFPGLD